LIKLLITALFFTTQAFALETVTIAKQIEIDIDEKLLFEFVSNPLNDHKWRSEVNDISTEGELQEGSVFVEDAFIGLRRNFITKTQLVQLSFPHIAVFETTDDNPYFLRSTRMVTKVGDKIVFKYLVEFDKKMIKKVFGLGVPASVVRQAYGLRMTQYLLKLRSILEAK